MPNSFYRLRTACTAGGLAFAFSFPAMAQEPKPADEAREEKPDQEEPIAYKLTPTYQSTSDGTRALDLNLRASKGPHYGWIAVYRDNQGGQQWRTGYEYRIEKELYRLVLSPQWAGGGFLAASFAAELGRDTFAIAGWSRSNLRPAYNLFFDPGDAITLGVGTRAIDKLDLSLFQVRDDRLGTGQRVTHVIARWRPAKGQRLTLDIAHKRGIATDGVFVRGYSYSFTYDYGNYFLRIARDPYVSFSPATMIRFAIGLRF